MLGRTTFIVLFFFSLVAHTQEIRIGFIGPERDQLFLSLASGCNSIICSVIRADGPIQLDVAAQRLIESERLTAVVIDDVYNNTSDIMQAFHDKGIPVVLWERHPTAVLFGTEQSQFGVPLTLPETDPSAASQTIADVLSKLQSGEDLQSALDIQEPLQCPMETCRCSGGGCSKHCCGRN
jgi:hypothetical protein